MLPEVLVSDRTDIPAIPGLGEYVDDGRSQSRPRATPFARQARDRSLPFASPYLAHVMEIEGHAQRSSEELPQLIAGYTTQASYPATALGRSLALAAQIVGSNLGTKVIYVEHGSFDTHVNQKATQNTLLLQFSDAIAAFYEDLAAHGNERPRAHAHLQRVRAADRRERQPRNRPRRSLAALPDRRRRQRRPLWGGAGPCVDEYGQRAL